MDWTNLKFNLKFGQRYNFSRKPPNFYPLFSCWPQQTDDKKDYLLTLSMIHPSIWRNSMPVCGSMFIQLFMRQRQID